MREEVRRRGGGGEMRLCRGITIFGHLPSAQAALGATRALATPYCSRKGDCLVVFNSV